MSRRSRAKPPSPFRYFNSSPEVIRLVVMMYVRFPLSFTMVTCDANELVAPIHPKTMITILPSDDHERWLTGSYDDVVAL
jgi:putative SOS response-associated peptidase YedK